MKILFVTSNRIGDAVLSTGLLDHLLATYPEARVTLACGPAAAPLFAATPNLEEIIPLPKQPWAGHWFRLWRRVVTTVWDLVVDLRASALAWLVPARRRRVLRSGKTELHQVRLLASVLGLAEPPAPRVWIAEAHIARARALIPDQGPVLGVGPTANWGGKQWPAERFGDVVARLTAAGGILPGARVAPGYLGEWALSGGVREHVRPPADPHEGHPHPIAHFSHLPRSHRAPPSRPRCGRAHRGR